jgi:hypothetical protein
MAYMSLSVSDTALAAVVVPYFWFRDVLPLISVFRRVEQIGVDWGHYRSYKA